MIISSNSLSIVLKLCYILESHGKLFLFKSQCPGHTSELRNQHSLKLWGQSKVQTNQDQGWGNKQHAERSSQWSKGMRMSSMRKHRNNSKCVSGSQLGVAVRHRQLPTSRRRLSNNKSPGGNKQCFPIHTAEGTVLAESQNAECGPHTVKAGPTTSWF